MCQLTTPARRLRTYLVEREKRRRSKQQVQEYMYNTYIASVKGREKGEKI